MDFKFFKVQAGQGPVIWGDLILTDDGDLERVTGDQADNQAATVRLMTVRRPGYGFKNHPTLGADLDRLLGHPVNESLLAAIEQQSTAALTMDSRFPPSSVVKAVPFGSSSVRLYVLLPRYDNKSPVLTPPISFDAQRGVIPERAKEAKKKLWVWRRGEGAIQQGYRMWRGWIGQDISFRLTPERLIVTTTTVSDLSTLGLFYEPLLIYKTGFLFCGKGPSEKTFTPRAWVTTSAWNSAASPVEVTSLPTYSGIPDGVWCEPGTDWNIAIIINGETAGQYNEALGQWEFLSVVKTYA